MPNCRTSSSAKHWASSTHAAMSDVATAKSIDLNETNPRRTMLNRQIEEEAVVYVREALRPKQETFTNISENHGRYVGYDSSIYSETIKRNSGGEDGALARLPLTTREGVLPGPAPETYANAPAAIAREGRPTTSTLRADVIQAYTQGYYGSEAPVTLYSARVPEGVLGMTAAMNAGAAAGRRNSVFSTPLEIPHRPHDGAEDVMEGVDSTTTLGNSIRPGPAALRRAAPGSEIVLAALFLKFADRFRFAKVDLPAFIGALQRHSTPTDLGVTTASHQAPAGTISPRVTGSADMVPSKHFRRLVHDLKLQLPDLDLEAVIAACCVDGTERVSLAALKRHLKGVNAL